MLEYVDDFWCLEHRQKGQTLLSRDWGQKSVLTTPICKHWHPPTVLCFLILQTAISPCTLITHLFLMQNLKMERKNEELHAEKEAGKVSHLNITEFGASIWLSQHGSGLQRSDLETINHKKPLNGTRSECWSPGLLSTQLSKCFSNREPRHCIQIVLKAVLPSFTSSTYNPFGFGHASCIIKLFLSHFDASRNLL